MFIIYVPVCPVKGSKHDVIMTIYCNFYNFSDADMVSYYMNNVYFPYQ